MQQFTVTTDHIRLISNMCVSWDDCEFGAPSIDCKRPYGNSDVVNDIANILDWTFEQNEDDEYPDLSDQQYDQACKLHEETQTVLQILIDNLSLTEGMYEREELGGKWSIR